MIARRKRPYWSRYEKWPAFLMTSSREPRISFSMIRASARVVSASDSPQIRSVGAWIRGSAGRRSSRTIARNVERIGPALR